MQVSVASAAVRHADRADMLLKPALYRHFKRTRKRVVNAAIYRVEVGVLAERGDAVSQEQRDFSPDTIVIVYLLQIEEKRVVGEDYLSVLPYCLINNIVGYIQRYQRALYLALVQTNEEPNVVKIHFHLRRHKLCEVVYYIPNLSHFSPPAPDCIFKSSSSSSRCECRRSAWSAAALSSPAMARRSFSVSPASLWGKSGSPAISS